MSSVNKTKYERKCKVIKNIHDGTNKSFDYINEAKRESRKLQQAEGGLGCGVLIST